MNIYFSQYKHVSHIYAHTHHIHAHINILYLAKRVGSSNLFELRVVMR